MEINHVSHFAPELRSAERHGREAPTDEDLTVLVVDDSPDDLLQFSRMLLSLSQVKRAPGCSTIADAEKIIEESEPDAVLVDFNLGIECGMDLFDKLHIDYPDLPFILITGHGSEAIASETMRRGIADYLIKDQASPATLLQCLIRSVRAARNARRSHRTITEAEHFVRTLVHDVRAPFRHIRYLAEFIEEDLDAGKLDEIGQHVGGIRKSVARTEEMLEALRAFTIGTCDPPALSNVDMNEAVQSATDLHSRRIDEAGASVQIDDLPHAVAHGPQMVQLFENLLGNALKYNESDTPMVHVFASAEPSHIVFTVRDNGIGIPGDQVEKVFEPLHRLHSRDRYEGSGLGLAICKKNVAALGGRIWVESQPEGGTEFRFSLPVCDHANTLPPWPAVTDDRH